MSGQASRVVVVAGVLRDAWHAATRPEDPASCPGCPICRVTEALDSVPPEALAHVEAAVGHLAAAGRELAAALSTIDDVRSSPSGEETGYGESGSGGPGTAGATHRAFGGSGTGGSGTGGSGTEGSGTEGSGTEGSGTGGSAARQGAAGATRDGPGVPAPGRGRPVTRERIEIVGEATPPAAGPDKERA